MSKFLNEANLHLKVVEMVQETGCDHLEALASLCEENDIEFDTVKRLMSVTLRDLVKKDAINRGMLPEESTLE